MIVKNEENTIERCLESVKDIVDEILIVDTGSNDTTKELAEKFTSKIYDFEWIDDFSAARNFSFSKATKDYILWLDADDVLLPEDVEKFKSLKATLDPSADSITMKYNLGTDEYGNVLLSHRRTRLVKRANNFKWLGFVHEYLSVYGNIVNSEISITHKKYDACWTWLPHLQLCLCYDRLGNHKLAYVHNEIASKFRPNDERILYNKKYFEDLGFK